MCLSKNNSQALRSSDKLSRDMSTRIDADDGVKERVGTGGHTMMAELVRGAGGKLESQLDR